MYSATFYETTFHFTVTDGESLPASLWGQEFVCSLPPVLTTRPATPPTPPQEAIKGACRVTPQSSISDLAPRLLSSTLLPWPWLKQESLVSPEIATSRIQPWQVGLSTHETPTPLRLCFFGPQPPLLFFPRCHVEDCDFKMRTRKEPLSSMHCSYTLHSSISHNTMRSAATVFI